MNNLTKILLVTFFVSGCSIMPYENDYSCRIKDNFGKCMSIQQSYDGSKGQDLEPGTHNRISINGEKRNSRSSKSVATSSQDEYLQSLYSEMADLIHQPETPMVKPAKTIRTLILSYSGTTDKKTLYMPRFVYSIVDDAEFILNQYYRTPERDANMISPRDVK